MTLCNQCGMPMVPDESAIVPALGCLGCGRLIPRPGPAATHRPKGSQRAELLRVRRAARRMKARQ